MSDEQNPPSAAPQKSAPKKPAAELKSPREWATALGHGPKQLGKNQWVAEHGMSGVYGSAHHEVARMLHGWGEHEHETGGPIQLTREDYEAALAATHPEKGNPVPHPGALSPYKGKRGLLALGQKPEASK